MSSSRELSHTAGSALEKKPSEVLEAAAALIEPEGAWTQVRLAADADGIEVSPLSPGAVCWCAAGAIARARGAESDPYHNDAVGTLLRVVPPNRRGCDVWEWNDNRHLDRRNQGIVVAALRKAAELARSEGQ